VTLRIGLVGAAGHVNYVTNGIEELGDAVLAAVAPGCPEEDGARLKKLGGETATYYADYHDLLDEELGIVAVAPFYYLHAEITVAALRAGHAVYCEKPLALTHPSLNEVRDAQRETGFPVGIMLDFRYNPAFYTARKLVAEGAIGTPTVAYGQKSYKRGNRPDFYRKRKTFGGITPWVGIHAIDWVRYVAGVDYRAVTSQHVKLHRPDYPDMEDAATCIYELANGGTAVMSFDFLRPAGAPSHGDDRLRILGEKGALEIREDCGLQLITEDGVQTIEPETPPHGCFADFALSVANADHECLISTEDALRVTEIALRTRDAADEGMRVELH
jgi:predicted dehydrogenase